MSVLVRDLKTEVVMNRQAFNELYSLVRYNIKSKKLMSIYCLAQNYDRKVFKAIDYALVEPSEKSPINIRLYHYKASRKLVPKRFRY